MSPQQNYSTFERECLAIVAAVTQFCVYLLARPFVLRTDHKALTWLFSNKPKASARISSWIATLLEYPIVVEYIKGTENTIADVLSRFTRHAVDQMVPPELANGTISFVCPVSDAVSISIVNDFLRYTNTSISQLSHSYCICTTTTSFLGGRGGYSTLLLLHHSW